MGNACGTCYSEVVLDDDLQEKVPLSPDTVKANKGRRPFQVVLSRMGSHWNNIGLVLSPDDSPTYLTIDDMWEPSLLSEWNAKQDKLKQVRIGDMIQAVNGVSTMADQMLLRIQSTRKGEELKLLIEPGPESFDGIPVERDPVAPSVSTPRLAQEKNFAQTGSQTPFFFEPPARSRSVHPELRPHFATLNIAENSSRDAVDRHYRRLARLWHPALATRLRFEPT